MPLEIQSWLSASQWLMQRLALVILASFTAACLVWTVAAIAGWAPWLHLTIGVGATTEYDGGVVVQLMLTLLLLGLCFFVPTNIRVMALERAHRDFKMSMSDIAQAYTAAHAADREGAFNLPSEFDSVRERLIYLRQHADLEALEPDILELAAQMSHESRELADRYAVEKVERAREFLFQRQQEAQVYQDRARRAHAVCHDIRHWLDRVETEEAIARSQLRRLQEDLDALLPRLGLKLSSKSTADVVSISRNKTVT